MLAHGYPRQQQKQGLGQSSGSGLNGSYDGLHSTLASNNNVNNFGLSTVTRDLPWDLKDKQHKVDKGNSNTHTSHNRPPGTPAPAPTSSTPVPPPSLADLNLDPRLATLAKDLSPLHFETELNFADYETYCTILGKISLSSRTDPVPLLELSQWLLTTGLGVESIAVLNNALEILNGEERPIPISDLIVAQIVLTKLSTKYFGRFGKFRALRALLDCALDSPDVVATAAGYMHHLQYTQQAEELYLGALVLDPACATALQGYARILVDKGLYHAAHRCLSRVPDHR